LSAKPAHTWKSLHRRRERDERKEATQKFTHDERAAMKERAQELKAQARRSPRADKKADGESDVPRREIL
jgi:hypothetical protein